MVRFLCYFTASMMLAAAWVAIGVGLGLRDFTVGYFAGVIGGVIGAAWTSGART